MQIKKAPINDCLRVSKVSSKFHILTIYKCCSSLPVKFAIFLKIRLLFNGFYYISGFKQNVMAQ